MPRTRQLPIRGKNIFAHAKRCESEHCQSARSKSRGACGPNSGLAPYDHHTLPSVDRTSFLGMRTGAGGPALSTLTNRHVGRFQPADLYVYLSLVEPQPEQNDEVEELPIHNPQHAFDKVHSCRAALVPSLVSSTRQRRMAIKDQNICTPIAPSRIRKASLPTYRYRTCYSISDFTPP
ncbi:hypothetical protein AMATHDRAFT_48665 [Amanita thiersii Skay4041]|uniref:Uncharacterized protein n=1 Tax=Amanita thiersii Skay4041 TaxID=703135 RepID=A0A2A9NPA5_9AGAR|nr:hypothetical protein AMATHDRAFT_48665 [Amanita thiersii Skay4041]